MRPEPTTPRRRKLHTLDRRFIGEPLARRRGRPGAGREAARRRAKRPPLGLVTLLLVVVLAACVDTTPATFFITSLSPDKALAGSKGFTLTVKTGGPTSLVPPVEVLFNGSARQGTVVDVQTVTAPISAGEVSSPGKVDVAVRMDTSTDPSAPNLFTTDPVSFTIEDASYKSIAILPSDTTVAVGESVTYRAEALRLPDMATVDVTSEMVFKSTQPGVATMDVDVAQAVGPGQTTITGAHISGAPVTSATLTVSGGGGSSGGSVQFVIAGIGATSVDVGCFDLTTDAFTTPTVLDLGASVTDVAYVPAVDAYVAITASDFKVLAPKPGCGIEIASSKAYSNLNAYRDLLVVPASFGGAVVSGNSLQGNDVGIWEVMGGPTYQINELEHIPATGGAVHGIGISQDGGALGVVLRGGVTTQLWRTPVFPPTSTSWATGGAIAVSPSISTWGQDADFTNVIGAGSVVQAFQVDHMTLDLMPIGSPLTSTIPLLKTVATSPSPCFVGVPLTGNSVSVYSAASDGSLAAESPATVSEAQFVDDAATFPDGVVFGIETSSGRHAVKFVRVGAGCTLDTSVSAELTSGSGFANLAASLR